MKSVLQMTSDERKMEFESYMTGQDIKSAKRYIRELEVGFLEAPVANYKSIFDISDPNLLEDRNKTKGLRESSKFTRTSKGGTQGLAGLNWYIRFLKGNRDSYYAFFNHFGIKQKEFCDWGMKATIFPPAEDVALQWEDLKRRVFNNGMVSIRGYKRDAVGTPLFIEFYKTLFRNESIKKDPTNNSKPQQIIKKTTGLTRKKDIYNYQVSHIWGRTKNPLLFEAAWNICYTPKIIDPFTGHESNGDLPEEFQERFKKQAFKKYKKFIDDYNRIITDLNVEGCLKRYCDENGISDERFYNDALVELSPIE